MMMKWLHKPVYARRLAVLTELIVRHLSLGDRVLDVGSGSGLLGRTIMEHPLCPEGVQVLGLEKFPRGGEAIPTIEFDGYAIPAADGEYDVTILADVVHHEEQPDRLLKEVARVTRRNLIVKDHVAQGPLSYQRICLMDWAANRPYGVKCLYRYFSPAEWRDKYAALGLTVVEEKTKIDLYPPVYNTVFGKRLQYFAVTEKRPA